MLWITTLMYYVTKPLYYGACRRDVGIVWAACQHNLTIFPCRLWSPVPTFACRSGRHNATFGTFRCRGAAAGVPEDVATARGE